MKFEPCGAAGTQEKIATNTQVVLPAAARTVRAQRARAAAWLRAVWGDDPLSPAFHWQHLDAVPLWAQSSPAQLEQLVLTTGTLFAAPALRVCLRPAPLLAVRALIGAEGLDRVLRMSGLPLQGPAWQAADGAEHQCLWAWGAALLVASVSAPPVRASVARVLEFWVDASALPPPLLAAHMVGAAWEIVTHVPHAPDEAAQALAGALAEMAA